MVTEGYIRLPPLPPTHLVLTSGQFCPTFIVVIYNVFCVCCSKNMVFLQGFVAFDVLGFHLGDVKKLWVFRGFWPSEGFRNGKFDVLTKLAPT